MLKMQNSLRLTLITIAMTAATVTFALNTPYETKTPSALPADPTSVEAPRDAIPAENQIPAENAIPKPDKIPRQNVIPAPNQIPKPNAIPPTQTIVTPN
jgi:hypothetical protein